MYQAVILEDEAVSAEAIASMVEASPYAPSVSLSTVDSPSKLFDLQHEGKTIDILFADIRLGKDEINGIQAAKELLLQSAKTQVIYITGYAEYCVPVYETEHAYFLLKPVDQTTFDKALDRAISNLDKREGQVFPVTFRGTTTLVPVVDIEYVESKLRKIVVHTKGAEFETYATIEEALQKLPPSFVRVHKGFIVNMDVIRKVDSSEIVTAQGARIPVGRTYKNALLESLAAHIE